MESRKQLVNEELERYIASRKKRTPWTGVFASREKKMEPTVQPYKEEQVSEEEYEQGKGFFAKMAEKLFGEKPAAEPAQIEVQPEIDAGEILSDMKELSRISLSIIKQLPPEQVQELKQTQDFERFKEILRKHKIIK
ncbi:hypothetical protein HY642_04740 [Candidatus Woesearchaeota archaeon]|nr:hypothetical protein [Candidatus Woesearchaeota archaeon]